MTSEPGMARNSATGGDLPPIVRVERDREALYERVAAMLCQHVHDAEPHEATAEAIDANHGVTARTIVRLALLDNRAVRPEVV